MPEVTTDAIRRYKVAFTAEFSYEVPAFDPEMAKKIACHWWFQKKRPDGTQLPTEITVTEIAEKRTWFRKESSPRRLIAEKEETNGREQANHSGVREHEGEPR